MGPKPTDREKKHCDTAAYQTFEKYKIKLDVLKMTMSRFETYLRAKHLCENFLPCSLWNKELLESFGSAR